MNHNFNTLEKNEIENINGGIVISTTTLLTCAGCSFFLGGVTGAGIYVGYKNTGK